MRSITAARLEEAVAFSIAMFCFLMFGEGDGGARPGKCVLRRNDAVDDHLVGFLSKL
jgi:hypothetical protein